MIAAGKLKVNILVEPMCKQGKLDVLDEAF